MSISIKNITKLYGKQRALDDVSFEVKSGEIVGLLGPNGAGKSTMMKVLTCFIPQSSGEASVCGYDVVEEPMKVKQKVGYLPETNPLYMDMYVREYLKFIAGIHKLGRNTSQRIEEIISITGLTLEQNKKISQLSKGYKQRVGLAQALIHDPDVLILDEPTSGLDPNQLVEIRNLIKEIGKEKTVMLSTHIMQEVEAMCDKVIIIDKGKIVANTSTTDIYKLQSNKQIIVVEFDKLVQKSMLESIHGVSKVLNRKKNTWELQSEEEFDIRNNIFKFAVDNDYTVLSLNNEVHSIERIFQELTKE